MPLLKIQKPYIILFMGYAKLHTQQQILEQHGFQYQVISKLFKTLVQGSEVFQNLVQFKSILGKYIQIRWYKSALFSDQNLQSNNISGWSNSFLKDYLPTLTFLHKEFCHQKILYQLGNISFTKNEKKSIQNQSL